MKKLFVSAVIAMSVMMASADNSAQGMRGGRTGQRVETTNRGSAVAPSRPTGGMTGNNNVATRPGGNSQGNVNNNNNQNIGNRPGFGGSNGNVRPGSNSNGGNSNVATRPGGNNNGGNSNVATRPGGNNNGYRPGVAPSRPSHNYQGPVRPGVTRPTVWAPPYRPGMAPVRPFVRPTPPATWRRPTVSVNLWTNILGVNVGISFNNAIDRLLYGGYTVTGYNANEIYLSNVPMYNLYWPDATMYYNGGSLIGSRFFYSTLGYDMYRYNEVFAYLTSMYGQPIVLNRTTDGCSATWFGAGNQYITLDYGPQLTDAGRRYFTTLSIGI